MTWFSFDLANSTGAVLYWKSMDSMDLLIASQAIANNMTLVSDDKVFVNIKVLKLENWLKS